MKNGCKGPAVFMALFVAGSAFAEMKNEPADFQGVTWDEPFGIAGARMVILRDEGTVKYYKRAGDTLKFGRVDTVKIAYRYYKNHFSSGVIQTFGGANQKAILDSLAGMFGDPVRPRQKFLQYFWDGENAYIVLTCEVNSYCVTEINSKVVIQREQAETGEVAPVQRRDED
ncbi:MAG: hypothetical protein EXR36_10515 [Betaproteobacteria bacterium]|nr:hypothetical protein [Betaproteobacteria bacterium]